MEKPKKTILVATPMYGGMCTAAYTESMLALQHVLLAHGYGFGFATVQNESLITRARNELVNQFLKTQYDYLLFIDADHRFDPFGIIKMIEEDVDIICAIPPKKTINWETVKRAHELGFDALPFFSGNFVVSMENGQSIYLDQKFEITYGGTGLMLIKRHVFDIMQHECSWYYKNNSMEDVKNKVVITEFFKTSIKENILMSEDYDFCNRWTSMGGKIYAAPWLKITHIGTYEFSGSWQALCDLREKDMESQCQSQE